MHGQTHVELWISSVFCELFVSWGTKIDENVVPEPIRDQGQHRDPKKVVKSAKKGLDFMPSESVPGGILETFRHFFAGRFLMSFGDVPFSLVSSIWAPKVPERMPKGSPK